MTKLWMLLFTACVVSAQAVSFGVKGGVPITDAFETFKGNQSAYFTNTKRYLIGPTVQFNMGRFAIEVDALYKRLGYQYEQTSPTTVAQQTRANSWEFPVLGKFAIFPGPVRPFVDAGASFRNISGVETIRSVIDAVGVVTNSEFDTAPEFNRDTDIGFVFGGGVEFKLGRVRLTPELRYTRWGTESFRDPINSLLRTNRNQGDFLFGVTF